MIKHKMGFVCMRLKIMGLRGMDPLRIRNIGRG